MKYFTNMLFTVILFLYTQQLLHASKGQYFFVNDEDSTFKNFATIRVKIAKAQINLLKNKGALLVRLKTNATAISKLKASGNIDLAVQLERETNSINKNIVRAYTKEFIFCPVYFFNSNYSDSVKHQHLTGIFLDTNLITTPTIVCRKYFYLVAEQGTIVSSSIGFVNEQQAANARQTGADMKTVFAVLKNRYFIQLHQPFPYFQKGTGFKLKNYMEYVKNLNIQLETFYLKNKEFRLTPDIQEFIY